MKHKSTLSNLQLDHAERLLKQFATGIKKTQNGTGIFLLPLVFPERDDELEMLARAIDYRLLDIKNPDVRYAVELYTVELRESLKKLFTLMLGYVKQGDAWPPAPAEANNALLWSLAEEEV